MKSQDSEKMLQFKAYMRAATSVSFDEMARRGFAFQQKMKTDPLYSPDTVCTIKPNAKFDGRPLNERADYAAEYIFMSFIRASNKYSPDLDEPFINSAFQHTIIILSDVMTRAGVAASRIFKMISSSYGTVEDILQKHLKLRDQVFSSVLFEIAMQANYNKEYLN